MSFSQRAPWNHFGISSDQFQQPTVPALRGRQHNEFNLLQSNNSSGHQWENNFPPNAQFASCYDSMNILCSPPPNIARFPPPGLPPPPQNSFSTHPPTIPPPNSTFSFNSTAGKQHGVTFHPPNMHTFPQNLNLKNLSLQIVSNQYNQASFMPTIPLRNPSSFSQFVPSAVSVSPSPNKTGTESEIEKSQQYKAVGYQKLERWLQCNKKPKKSEPKTSHQKGKESVKIWDFLNKMKGMHGLISDLSTHVATLSANVSISDNSAWEASKSQCNVIKEKLSSGFDYLLTDNHLQEVNKKLICIRHKRKCVIVVCLSWEEEISATLSSIAWMGLNKEWPFSCCKAKQGSVAIASHASFAVTFCILSPSCSSSEPDSSWLSCDCCMLLTISEMDISAVVCTS
ncbi:hypothetical protein PoB_005142900 [Plakobranchus ocellatus]|uniref:Uncharacterized protein n=1 Tax=Plakobranchus ocellatus TaxID=259542 RepID=A0AAV4C1C2_9GAST|nr:hypothetical protein PoB_005142900 [Plakobranchus ocellatus]